MLAPLLSPAGATEMSATMKPHKKMRMHLNAVAPFFFFARPSNPHVHFVVFDE
jgi:hypothetical protein